MQVALELSLLVLPTAAVAWWAATFLFVGEAQRASRYFEVAPRPEIVWHLGLYAFVTGWVTIVLISVVGCLFVRCTSAAPGLYPARGLRAALLLYRVKKLNQIQRLWTWTVIGQYLRALAGVRFTRVGALGVRPDDQPGPGARRRRLAGVLVPRLLHQHARPSRPAT